MKIAFLTFYSGHLYRGVETYVDELATRLSKDHEIHVYQSGPAPQNKLYVTKVFPVSFPKIWPDDNLSAKHILKRFFIHYYKRKEFKFFLKALPSIVRSNYDIIIPLNSGWPILILRLLTWLTRKKLVLVGQSGPGWDDRWLLLNKPDLFICLTKRQLKWAKRVFHWPNQKFKIIANGVDLNKFSSTGKKIKLPLQRPIILVAAALEVWKRVEESLKAVSKLEKASLLILGKGPLDKKIDKLGEKLLGKKRFMHTTVAHSDMPQYYRAADLFSLCSISTEAFGIVYVEALASGLKVVATDDDSRREIIGGAGFYVKDPQDSDEYAAVIQKALNQKPKTDPIQQAKKYSWDQITKQYQESLAKLL